MPMLDPRYPLWLPKGSIRGVLALLIVVFGGGYLITAGATEAVIAIVSTVATFYFVERGREAPTT
jgi:hypothetical protein